MADSTTNPYTQVDDLGVIRVTTSPAYQQLDPQLSGVALLNPATAEKLQSYTNLSDVEKDYDASTKVYNEAAGYFNNAVSPLFQVLNYASSGASTSTSTTTPSTNTNNGTNTTNNTNTGAPVVIVPKTDSNSTQTPNSDADNAVAAVQHYFGAQFEHLIVPVDSSNQAVAIAVSQFVEAQHQKLVYLEIAADAPANGSGPDFSWLKPIVGAGDGNGNFSTFAFSLPNTEGNEFNLAGAFLSVFANATVGFNPEFTKNLDTFGNFKPQDFYNFVKADYDKYYAPYNVSTYAYRDGDALFTSNYSLAGYQFQVMLVRDYIIQQIREDVLNLFENNQIDYDVEGVNMVTDQLRLVLNGLVKSGVIADATVTPIDPTKIAEASKAAGHLTGLNFDWTPNWAITDVSFHQSIEFPEL